MVPPPGRRRRAHHIMAPKKRKSAPDWRETLFFWRGELRHEPDASEIVWSGKWVGSSDLELPSAQSFAESPNTFELRGHVKVTPPVEWAFREQHAYMLSGLTTPLVGSYLLDGESTKDDEHHLRLATLAPDEKSPMTTIAAAVGNTRFGRFISLGKVMRQAAVTSGAGASDASEPATSSGRLILLLVRRYVDRRDPRSKLASPAHLPLPALLTSPSMLAAPWSALPRKLDGPLPTAVPTGKNSPIDWEVLMPNPGDGDHAWVEGRREPTRFNRSGRWCGLVQDVSTVDEDLHIVSWRQANNHPAAFFPGGKTMGKFPSYRGSGCEEV